MDRARLVFAFDRSGSMYAEGKIDVLNLLGREIVQGLAPYRASFSGPFEIGVTGLGDGSEALAPAAFESFTWPDLEAGRGVTFAPALARAAEMLAGGEPTALFIASDGHLPAPDRGDVPAATARVVFAIGEDCRRERMLAAFAPAPLARVFSAADACAATSYVAGLFGLSLAPEYARDLP